MLKTLFLHGGPGLNSEAERRILAARLNDEGFDFHFWNEPSQKRPEGSRLQKDRAWSGWLQSAETVLLEQGPFELVVASSFGALAALHLLSRNPKAFDRLVMISPTLDLLGTFHKMMRLAIRDFESEQPQNSAKLTALLKQSAGIFDQATQQAMALVYQDPLLFGHYWINHEVLGQWAAVLGEPRFGVDMDSQCAVLQELAASPPAIPAIQKGIIPLLILIGDHDPVRDDERNLSIARPFFARVEQRHFALSGHFPHLEEPGEFIKALKAFCAIA